MFKPDTKRGALSLWDAIRPGADDSAIIVDSHGRVSVDATKFFASRKVRSTFQTLKGRKLGAGLGEGSLRGPKIPELPR